MPTGIHNRLTPYWSELCKHARSAGCSSGRDLAIFTRRAQCEGLPFLTDGLAGLGRLLLDGLRKGYVTKEEVISTRFELKVGSTLPMFLYAAWSQVFDDEGFARGADFDRTAEVPRLVTWEPSYQTCAAVRWLRQLTIVFSKLRLPYAQDRIQGVIDRFIANEESLGLAQGRLLDPTYTSNVRLSLDSGARPLASVLLHASKYISRILCNADPRDIIPRHGSGASACMTRPWERYTSMRYHSALDAIWPYDQFALMSHSQEWDSGFRSGPDYPKRARCVLVPKDYRGPRLISCEPAESMYYQQGLMTLLVNTIEHHPMTSGFVNFTNQRVNQRLAAQASRDRAFATLDLKDASDLVSWDLVRVLWPINWIRALSAVRSSVTYLPPEGGGRAIGLRKHAPMGSAVCFPVMALTLWAIIKAATVHRAPCWVYGDDIITRCSDAPDAITAMTAVGLTVNQDKSFIRAGSPFRESCGVEYFGGENVTPIYFRYDPTTRVSEQSSIVSFANNISERYGSPEMFDLVELAAVDSQAPMWGGSIPAFGKQDTANDLSLLPELNLAIGDIGEVEYGVKPRPLLLHGLVDSMPSAKRPESRWNPRLQRREYRIRVPVAVNVGVNPDASGYVLRALLVQSQFFGFDCTHALAKRVKYKYRWVCLDW